MDGNFNAAVYRQRIGELTQRAKHLDRRSTDMTIGESCYLLSLIAAIHDYRIGGMTADDLVHCQRDLQMQLERYYQHHEIADNHISICNRYSHILVEAEKHGCPICQRLVRIFDGRETGETMGSSRGT